MKIGTKTGRYIVTYEISSGSKTTTITDNLQSVINTVTVAGGSIIMIYDTDNDKGKKINWIPFNKFSPEKDGFYLVKIESEDGKIGIVSADVIVNTKADGTKDVSFKFFNRYFFSADKIIAVSKDVKIPKNKTSKKSK